MSENDLYLEIGKWINIFHRRDWYYTGLLRDFHHDLWLIMREKSNINTSYIKQRCFYYPLSALRYKYYNRARDFSQREVVLLDEQGAYVEFAGEIDAPFEFETKQTKSKRVLKYKERKTIKPVCVTYITGVKENFPSVPALAEAIGVHKHSIYNRIGKPLAGRFTKRKMSHVKLIEYINVDTQSISRINSQDNQKDNTKTLRK